MKKIQNNRKPIVVTGAQKPIDLETTDARTNLRDSLRIASDDRAYGVNIVFDGKVIAGTRAKKERAKSYNAFSSINYPDIAVIIESFGVGGLPTYGRHDFMKAIDNWCGRGKKIIMAA